ncbi:MAG: hypothetical protein ACMG6H_05995 [Acidobacteriota bacterium]
MSLTGCGVLYREAVATSSPTLPFGGYVGVLVNETGHNPIGVEIPTPRVAAAATLGWRI